MTKKMNIMLFLACLLVIWSPYEVESAGSLDEQGYQSIPDEKFRKGFIRYICDQLDREEADIHLTELKVCRNRPVPEGKISIGFNRKGVSRLTGYVAINATVSVNGIEENDVQLRSRVDVFRSVVCAARDLKRKDVVKKDDVYLARKNISGMKSGTMTELRKVVGLMVKHNVKADTCLREWMVEAVPLVERGDVVTITAESDDLKVTAPGRVLEKGCLGEFVRVQNTISKKRVYAKVINNSEVIVNF